MPIPARFARFTVTLSNGRVIRLSACCADPEPALRITPRPAIPQPERKQELVCVRCQTVLVELAWPNPAHQAAMS